MVLSENMRIDLGEDYFSHMVTTSSVAEVAEVDSDEVTKIASLSFTAQERETLEP